MTKFICSHCQFSKNLPDNFAGKKAKCPNCGHPSIVAANRLESLNELQAGQNALAKRKPWHSNRTTIAMFVFAVAALNAGGLWGMLQVQNWVRSTGNVAVPADNFCHESELPKGFTIVAKYPFRRMFIPSEVEKSIESIPQSNRTIDVEILKNGNPVEQTAGLFNIDGSPEKLTCRSSNTSVATASVVLGDAIIVTPMTEGKTTIFIKCMEKEFGIEFEFVQTPVVANGFSVKQTKQELIEKIGFPDSKETVYPMLGGSRMINGFRHELGHSYEHWRYKTYPGMFVVVESYGDDVVGMGNEH